MEKLDILKQRIDKFNRDRDWDQFHTPVNLAKSISIEAAELLECFQWSNDQFNKEEVLEELADVMNYCIQMSQVLDVDIIDIIPTFFSISIITKLKIMYAPTIKLEIIASYMHEDRSCFVWIVLIG